MKKLLLIPVLLSFLVFPAIGLAACDNDGICEPDQGEDPFNCKNDCVITTEQPILVLASILNWLFTILLVFAGIMIVVAAFYFVTASGNPETVAKARQFVIYALIGVMVALLARGMIWMVQKMIIGIPEAS